MSSLRVGSPVPQLSSSTPLAPTAPTQSAKASNAVSDSAAFASAAKPTPLPEGQAETAYDGAILGGDGHAYPAGSIDTIPAFKPQNGKSTGETIVYINGMGEHRNGAAGQAQQLANASGANVIGIDNATQGTIKDLLQCAGDLLHTGSDKAVSSLSQVIYDKMMAGQPLHLMGYSQGAIITSRALTDAQNRMMLEGGLSKDQVQQRMHSLLKVETVGGAAPHYPDGPEYVHYLNKADIVEHLTGLENPACKDGGKGAKYVQFSSGFDWNPFNAHHFDKYMAHYKPFDQVYNG